MANGYTQRNILNCKIANENMRDTEQKAPSVQPNMLNYVNDVQYPYAISI